MASNALPLAVREQLEDCSIVALVEYVAERLHVTVGEQRLSFELSDGHVRRARIAREPIGANDLDELGGS